ncbi:MAG: hypothetical protein JSU86_06985, partial [Phycisphaerales bacterium]
EMWLDHVTTMNREALREFFDFMDRHADSVNEEAIQQYVERLGKTNRPVPEIRRRVNTVKRFLTWAVGEELIRGAPLKDAAKLVVA